MRKGMTLAIVLMVTHVGQSAATAQSTSSGLDAPVSISLAEGGTPLSLLLSQLSSVSGVSFNMDAGSDVTVRGSFQSVSVRDILDRVCSANGLSWEESGGVVLVRRPVSTRVFQVQTNDVPAVQRLVETGALDRLVHGPGLSTEDEFYLFDSRTGILSVTAHPTTVARISDLLDSIPQSDEQRIRTEMRMFSVDPAIGPRLAALLEARLLAEGSADPHAGVIAAQRRIVLHGNSLIVRDTPDNIRRTEALLISDEFLRNVSDDTLEARVYSLVPRVPGSPPELAQEFADDVVTTVSTLLYAESGLEQARRSGRRLWYDPSSLTLTIVDRPDNLRRIDRHMRSVSSLTPERTVVRLPVSGARPASEIASRLEGLFDLQGTQIRRQPPMELSPLEREAISATQSGETITRSLRIGDEINWRGLRITLVDVNGPADSPDQATFAIDIGFYSGERMIRRLRSHMIDDFRIRVIDITRSGRVTVQVNDLRSDQPAESTTILR